jgi:microcin C transport system substrate-binding protein
VTEATSRSDLITAARALDRVLRAGRYWVPMWYKPDHRLALWDVYGHPSPGPAYDLGAPSIWWHDADKARRIGRN